MSKVICDVCGTAYPETAAQCPICGSAKNATNQTAAGNPAGEDTGSASYAYVKGGRFSKKNVRKRNKRGAPPTTAQRRSSGSSRDVRSGNEPNNTGLVIVVVLLMLAIVAVLIYIGVHFFNSGDKPDDTGNTGDSQSTVQTGDSEPSSSPVDIPCTGLELSNTMLELAVYDSWQLTVKLDPVDTTDEVVYTSENMDVAIVNANGEVTVVGEGETVITVTCGTASATCTVKTPDNSTVEPPVVGEFNFEFNTPYTDKTTGFGDTTLSAPGETWRAYKTTLEVEPADITWTSDNPEVCTIEKGIVTAVGPGKTQIHATYNGVTYSCVVRCSFTVEDVTNKCSISHRDVTISIGQSFTLKLKDGNGYTLDVEWTCKDGGVTIDGNKITGAKAGVYKVSTTYEGKTYSCTVRVKEK